MRITCPYCGPRDVREFSYLGDAAPIRPETADIAPDAPELQADAVHDYVHLRDNPAGPHRERWYHAPCRSWIVVARDTVTHRLLDPDAANPEAAR